MLQQNKPSKLPFIVHAQIPPLLNSFRDAVWSGDLVTLSGLRGTGKLALLKYFRTWIAEQPDAINADQMVIINLKASFRKTVEDSKVLSPMTLITYSLLWHELHMLGLPSYLQDDRAQSDNVKLYTDREFHRLLHSVEERVRRQHICAIGINHAERLDVLALQWLMDLHEKCDEQFALFLCGQLKDNEERDQPFRHLLKQVPEARDLRKERVEALLLEPVGEDEFRGPVMVEILKGINARLAPEVREKHMEFTGAFWEQTQGNWHAVKRLVKLYDKVLQIDSRSPRRITQEVVDEVRQRLTSVDPDVE